MHTTGALIWLATGDRSQELRLWRWPRDLAEMLVIAEKNR